jgi:hypothetical protein
LEGRKRVMDGVKKGRKIVQENIKYGEFRRVLSIIPSTKIWTLFHNFSSPYYSSSSIPNRSHFHSIVMKLKIRESKPITTVNILISDITCLFNRHNHGFCRVRLNCLFLPPPQSFLNFSPYILIQANHVPVPILLLYF